MRVQYVPEIAQYGPCYIPLNVFTVSKGSNFYVFYLLLLQLALCRVAALKSLPVHHPYGADYIISFGTLGSVRIFTLYGTLTLWDDFFRVKTWRTI